MTKLGVVILCLAVLPVTGLAFLTDPLCESSPPWTICTQGSMTTGCPCSPGTHAGTNHYCVSTGGGTLNESGIYECVPTVPGTYEVGCWFDMGLYPPYGGGSVFHLRVAPSPVACGALCAAGSALFTSNLHACGSWKFTGVRTFSGGGTVCIIAVACGNDGWSCGSGVFIDDFYVMIDAVDDWVLY